MDKTQEEVTADDLFLAWRRVINRDRAHLRSLTDKLWYCDQERKRLRGELAAANTRIAEFEQAVR